MVSGENKNQVTHKPDEEIYLRVATFIVRKGLTIPAVFMLETHKPLSFIASQFLVFLGPMVYMIFPQADAQYNRFVESLEHRDNIDYLIQCIEDEDKKLVQRVRELQKKNQNPDIKQDKS